MKKTILIVDDDPVLVRVLEQTFGKEGFLTVAAADGGEALKKFEAERPDLIVLDVHMPGVHGYSFLFELRKIEGGRDVPILVLTSNPDMKDVFTAEGVCAYLVKPCLPQTVLAKVKQYLK